MSQFFTPTSEILARLEANLGSVTPAILPVIDNQPFEEVAGVPFFVFAVDISTAEQASISGGVNKRFRTFGTIQIEIFTPIGDGVKLGLDYADQFADIFRSVKFGSVLCFAPTVLSSQQRKYKVGEWWSTPLLIPFQSEAFFAV